MPNIPNELRHKLNHDYQKREEYILNLLKKIDPVYLEMVDKNNHSESN